MDAVVGNITTLLKAKGMWESSLLVMSAVRALACDLPSVDQGFMLAGCPTQMS